MKTDNLHNDSEVFLAKWLEGSLSNEELKARVNKEDYNMFLKIRNGIEIQEQLNSSTTTSFNIIKERIAKNTEVKVKKLIPNWLIGIAASILFLLGWFMFFNNSVTKVSTGFGEQKIVQLLDGTQVILNAKSTLTYSEDDWANKRTLFLDGEAYFKVSKGNTFTVNTDNGSVEVLGTQFNVNTSKDFFDVVCYEGKVKVNSNKINVVLLPEDRITKISDKLPVASKVTNESPTWIKGESTFKSVPVSMVIEALEAQYNINIDDQLINSNEIFSGSFPHDSLSIALKTVFETLNVKYYEKEDRNIKLRYKE